jgi:hypothetical protein
MSPIAARPCRVHDAYALRMKLAVILLALSTGCAATASAVGSLVKPKPSPQITIVNTVEAPAPAPAPKPHGAAPAMVGGGITGAFAGGIAAALLRPTPGAIASGTLVGAGVGTALGYVVHEVTD